MQNMAPKHLGQVEIASVGGLFYNYSLHAVSALPLEHPRLAIVVRAPSGPALAVPRMLDF